MAGVTRHPRGRARLFIGALGGAAIVVLGIAPGARAATVSHFMINDVSVTEGNAGTANLTFTISYTGTKNNISVDWATANGTATAGADYVAASGTATFTTAGPMSQQITVVVNGDVLDEANETVLANLTNAQPPAIADITDSQGVGTITDDDPLPTLSIDDVSVVEGDAGTTTLGYTVSLSVPSGRAVNVTATTANGTATQPADYVSRTQNVAFAPGTTTQAFAVTVNGDLLDENDETVLVNLTSPGNATIADAQGVGTITDDDRPPGHHDQRRLDHRRKRGHLERDPHAHAHPRQRKDGHGRLRDRRRDGRGAGRLPDADWDGHIQRRAAHQNLHGARRRRRARRVRRDLRRRPLEPDQRRGRRRPGNRHDRRQRPPPKPLNRERHRDRG